ncbi:Tol-Pal system protein TolB [subsurface metagenome]
MRRILAGKLCISILVILALIGAEIWKFSTVSVSQELPGDGDIIMVEDVELRSTASPKQQQMIRALLQSGQAAEKLTPLTIDYPLDESIFPPEIVAPVFFWHDSHEKTNTWLIDVAFEKEGSAHIYVIATSTPLPAPEIDPECISTTNELPSPTPYQASAKNWTPDPYVWSAIKENSAESEATVTIYGFNSTDPIQVLSCGRMTMKTSKDPVGAPIFYRDVPLMPAETKEGVIMPISNFSLPLIAWRLRDISRPQSRVVLNNMPTCANCHSFSMDGKTLGMDIDGPSGDKGAYAIAPISQQMVIRRNDVISWNYSFKDKLEGKKTIGFMSQISPDGQYSLSTVNEDIYVQNFLDYRFLQVFYVTRGILAYYSRATGEFTALPGADNPDYVHCNPVWSPDGTFIVFARAKAKDSYIKDKKPAMYPNDPNETQIQYDLYRIPFNNGKGGEPAAISGASNNSMSNNFPKISPDGTFIVFVKCKNGQLMRPDSKLWIIPVSGGKARLMHCNTSRMNSWHSFSPNSRWMVFSSKANTPYTQMFLTHIDENGNDSPAILIPNSTPANRAVNIPEFINIPYDGLVSITVPEVEYRRYMTHAFDLFEKGLYDEAVMEWQKALQENPDDVEVRMELHNNLGTVLGALGKFDLAIEHFQQAIKIKPENGQAKEKLSLLRWMAKDPKMRDGDDAMTRAMRACELTFYRDPLILDLLARAHAEEGNFTEAVRIAKLAHWFARTKDREELIDGIQERLELYQQGKPYNR